MYRPLSLNRFKVVAAALLLAGATACASPTGPEGSYCRDEYEGPFDTPDSRPLCADVNGD
jgi:hypothetical protein